MSEFKILAVDDNPIIRKILETILESESYLVMLAAGGSEAVAVLYKEDFDLVITDLQMGDFDGFAVSNKAKDLNPVTQGIVITGNQDVSSAFKGLRIGVEDYLLKPFSSSVFQASGINLFLGVSAQDTIKQAFHLAIELAPKSNGHLVHTYGFPHISPGIVEYAEGYI